jgi:hypothetical protein
LSKFPSWAGQILNKDTISKQILRITIVTPIVTLNIRLENKSSFFIGLKLIIA